MVLVNGSDGIKWFNIISNDKKHTSSFFFDNKRVDVDIGIRCTERLISLRQPPNSITYDLNIGISNIRNNEGINISLKRIQTNLDVLKEEGFIPRNVKTFSIEVIIFIPLTIAALRLLK